MQQQMVTIQQQMADHTLEMRSGFAEMDKWIDVGFTEVKGEIKALDQKLSGEIRALDQKLSGEVKALEIPLAPLTSVRNILRKVLKSPPDSHRNVSTSLVMKCSRVQSSSRAVVGLCR